MPAKKSARKKPAKKSPAPRNKNGLTMREQEFADCYLSHAERKGNATLCYSFISPRASKATCETEGYKYLHKPAVKQYLTSKQQKAIEASDLSAEMIIRELMRLAFVDKSELYDDNNQLKNIRDMPEDIRRAIESVEMDGGRIKKVRLSSKTKALELLGKTLAMFIEKQELSGKLLVKKMDYLGSTKKRGK